MEGERGATYGLPWCARIQAVKISDAFCGSLPPTPSASLHPASFPRFVLLLSANADRGKLESGLRGRVRSVSDKEARLPSHPNALVLTSVVSNEVTCC